MPRVRAAVLALISLAAPVHALQPGDPFPATAEVEGTWPSDTRGKVLLVDFWASWCAPCKASFPVLTSLQEEYGEAGLLVVGISVDEKKGAYEQFLKRTKPGFVTVRDASHQLAAKFKVPTMPTSYLVDRKGVVRYVHSGYHADTAERLRRELAELLKEES